MKADSRNGQVSCPVVPRLRDFVGSTGDGTGDTVHACLVDVVGLEEYVTLRYPAVSSLLASPNMLLTTHFAVWIAHGR